MNCKWDSKKRSFWYWNVAINECNHCKEVESVEHLLLYCKHPDIVENREIFYTKYCQYVDNFNDKRACVQIRELLNVIPTCSVQNKEKAKESICTYIKKAYYNLDNKLNNI